MGAEIGAGQKSEPNVVPLCDILLVLLIIFMVITPLAQKGIDVKLPETGQADASGGSVTGNVLTIEKDMQLKINQSPSNFDMIENELRDLYASRVEKKIFIRADETIPYREVLRLIDIVRGVGIDVIGVITERYASQ